MCEAFKLQAGVDILHVPYRGGGESLADFLAGVVQIHADPNTMPHVSAGKAKLLAVLDRNRRSDFPKSRCSRKSIRSSISWSGSQCSRRRARRQRSCAR